MSLDQSFRSVTPVQDQSAGQSPAKSRPERNQQVKPVGDPQVLAELEQWQKAYPLGEPYPTGGSHFEVARWKVRHSSTGVPRWLLAERRRLEAEQRSAELADQMEQARLERQAREQRLQAEDERRSAAARDFLSRSQAA